MNFDHWIERIYVERDLGRNIAISISGITGLLVYLFSGDWVIAAFSAVIVFPITKVLAGALHSAYVGRRGMDADIEKAKSQFERLSDDEKRVLYEFVRLGGSVMSWSYANRIGLYEPAVSSLMQRQLLFSTMSADGMHEAFGITVDIFDVAKESYINSDEF